jgi:peptide chain release factor 1
LEKGGTPRTIIAKLKTSDDIMDRFVGTHRVQRISTTDTKGRRHTSTATVAILKDSEPHETTLNEVDVLVTAYIGSGPGGQNRNKVETAIRLYHIPTGIKVKCEDERSQHDNKRRAMEVLEKRLAELHEKQRSIQQHDDRNSQISSGERPVKEFTWNTQRNQVIDHSTGKTWNLKRAMKGKF